MSYAVMFSRGRHHCATCAVGQPETVYWCEHIAEVISSGADAEDITAPMSLVVPIFPDANVHAQIFLKDSIIPNGPAPMEMRFTPEIGRERVIPLGFWNPGEGMYSIRAVVIDYIKSKLDPTEKLTNNSGSIVTRCPSALHTFKASSEVANYSRDYPAWKLQCLWNLAMENACTICMELSSSGGGPDNFGVDDSVMDSNSFHGRFGGGNA